MRYISTNNLTITSYASRRIFFSRVLHRKKTDSCAPHVFINTPPLVSNFCFNLYFSSDSTTHSWKVRQKSKNKDGKYVRLGLDGMVGGGALGWQIGNTIIAANITNYSGTHWPGKHAGDMFGKKTLKDKHFTCHEMTPAYLIAKAAAISCTMPMQCFTHYTVGYMSDITLILANSQSFQH